MKFYKLIVPLALPLLLLGCSASTSPDEMTYTEARDTLVSKVSEDTTVALDPVYIKYTGSQEALELMKSGQAMSGVSSEQVSTCPLPLEQGEWSEIVSGELYYYALNPSLLTEGQEVEQYVSLNFLYLKEKHLPDVVVRYE